MKKITKTKWKKAKAITQWMSFEYKPKSQTEQDIEHLESMKGDLDRLYLFLKGMVKGNSVALNPLPMTVVDSLYGAIARIEFDLKPLRAKRSIENAPKKGKKK